MTPSVELLTMLMITSFTLLKGTEALQCFVCTANRFLNKDCRSLSAAQLIDCPDTSSHCNAIVTDMDGTVMVNRGCSGNVVSWGFGNDECDIMTNEKILDRAVAFYQCRGDGCNNIEPGQITTVDKIVNGVQSRVPQFAMNSQMRSQHTLTSDDAITDSRAIVSDQEDFMRRGKQIADAASDDSDDSYGLPGKERRTRLRLSTTVTIPTVKPVTTTTTTTTIAPKIPPVVRVVTLSPMVTRLKRPRHFTIFD